MIKTRFVAWLLALGAMLASPLALAQPAATAALDELSARAAREGSARVIVGLNVAARPEGELGVDGASQQRDGIASEQRSVRSLLLGTGHRTLADYRAIPFMALEVDANALARLRASPRVRSIEEDRLARRSLLESTAHIGATQAWNAGFTGSGWAVAILDTGVQASHPFLAGKVVSQACYSSNVASTSLGPSQSVCPGGVSESVATGSGVNCAQNGCDHGTHVAGIAAGTNAPGGAHGVGRGADLIAIQVFSFFPNENDVLSFTSDQIKGLERVFALRGTFNIAAVNMSLGGGQFTSQSTCDSQNSAIKAAIDNLRSVGIATVVAAGNDGFRSAMNAPACISSAISVGATCDNGSSGACATGLDGVASYSNITSFISLVAPGSLITSSVPTDAYAAFNGTSMAAPHVAGAWAVLKQANPGLSVSGALDQLRSGAVQVNDTRSGGVVSGLRRIELSSVGGGGVNHVLSVSKLGTGSGTVSSSPAGINCGSMCSASFASGTSVTLNAVAASGSTFAGWGGACFGTGACTVSMTQARSVTASFTSSSCSGKECPAASFTLSVSKSGNGSGTVNSSPAGIACGSACSASFASGTSVTLTPAASSGSTFTGWSGACSGTGACTVAMTQARSVGASFSSTASANQTLTVSKSGSGGGTVSSSPTGISCGATCSAAFANGSTVSLNAVADAGSTFTGWSGACSGSGACTVAMTQARSVIATFSSTGGGCAGKECTTPTSYTLSVGKTGAGSGSVTSSPAGINCGTTCSASFVSGTSVTLTAAASAGSTFTGWGGACSGSGACTVALTQARSVSANFEPATSGNPTLSVSKSGNGNGGVTSSPAGINCGASCSASYVSGTSVMLFASPDAGSTFGGWSGACNGTGSCTVSMTASRSVTAIFNSSGGR